MILVVTGTDTGVGKTWVSVGLCRALRQAGHSVQAIKPVESGIAMLQPAHEDGALLAAATGQAKPQRALFRLDAPLAPPLAADRQGVPLTGAALIHSVQAARVEAQVTLIEGAGGLLAPLAWDLDTLDLAHALDAHVLVVAADRLGCINHTLLTLSALARRHRPVLGVVLNGVGQADESTGSNAQSLARLIDVPVWSVPFDADPGPSLLPLVGALT